MDGARRVPRPPGDPLGAALLTARRAPWRSWAELGDAERVERYTQLSLYGVLWGFGVAILVAALPAGGTADDAVLLGGGGLLLLASSAAMAPLLRASPEGTRQDGRRLVPLALVAAAVAAVAIAAWDASARDGALIAVIFACGLPLSLLPDRRPSWAAVLGGSVLFGVADGTGPGFLAGAVTAAGVVASGRISLWVLQVVRELDRARDAQAQLAVVEERLRFSRDVHDVLGRRLSTIAVQAELAATLAERADPEAPARMLEVRGVAHDALREARELARSYRATDLATELDGARALLGSAGIDVRVRTDGLPRGWHEAAGWVVREAVTNVLRHSRAARVDITLADGRLRIANDGVPDEPSGGDGDGLRGLRERLAPLGATLQTGREAQDGWAVLAGFPGSGPLGARSGGPA